MRRGFSREVNQPVNYNLRSAPKLGLEVDLSSKVGETVDTNMATGFETRDDPEYLKAMEEELVKSRQARKDETKLQSSLVARMDRLEQKITTQLSAGRSILRTPLQDDILAVPGGRGHRLSSVDSVSGRLNKDMSEVAASDIVNGPLTEVLQQVSVAIDPTPQSLTKGLLLRPEYYVQHMDKGVPVKSLDHSKLSIKELMGGMGRVMSHLAKTGGNVNI